MSEDRHITAQELDRFEQVIEAKFSSLKAWGIAALLGGQALAGLIAAIVTRTTPTDVGRAADGVFRFLL